MQNKAVRTSFRQNKGISPQLLYKEVFIGQNRDIVLKEYYEAMPSKDRLHWVKAMHDEIKSMFKNEQWQLSDYPFGKSPLSMSLQIKKIFLQQYSSTQSSSRCSRILSKVR